MIDEQARERVKDRLTLVRSLIERNDPLAVPSGAGPTRGPDGRHDGGWLHEYAQLDSLVNYLLLTCFDVLGQRSHWTTFEGWLAGDRYAHERQDVLAATGNAADQLTATRDLHDHYNKLYGVRNSFTNFIDSVLASAARRNLLDSVRLVRFEPAHDVGVVDDDSERKRVLFGLRNEFTHKARLRGAPRMQDGSRLAPAWSAQPERTGLPGHHLFTEKGLLCMVHDWPFRLYESVASAVGAPLPDFDVKYTVMLTMGSGRRIWIEDVARAELADAERRARLFERVEEDARRYFRQHGETTP